MKKFIIKYWMLSYDVKVFGAKYRAPRVINTLIVLFVLAGLYNLLTVGFDIWQGLAFLPFFAVAIYTAKYKLKEADIQYLDWEQELQLMQKPDHVIDNYGFDLPQEEIYKWYETKYNEKYKGQEKFVHPWRFFHPFLWILLAVVIWGIFGFNEPGFPEYRGF